MDMNKFVEDLEVQDQGSELMSSISMLALESLMYRVFNLSWQEVVFMCMDQLAEDAEAEGVKEGDEISMEFVAGVVVKVIEKIIYENMIEKPKRIITLS